MKEETKRGSYAREKGEVVLREHEFDGIQEYDQKLPNWWLFTFYIAIVWFLIHWCVYYYTSGMRTDDENIRASMTAIQQKKDQELAATLASLDDTTLVTKWAADPVITTAGEATFQANCAACHAADLSATMTVDPGISAPRIGIAAPNPAEEVASGYATTAIKTIPRASMRERGLELIMTRFATARRQRESALL